MSVLQAGPTVPPCSYELGPGELSDTLLSLRVCAFSLLSSADSLWGRSLEMAPGQGVTAWTISTGLLYTK